MSKNRKTEQKKVYMAWAVLTSRFERDEEFTVSQLDEILCEVGMMDQDLINVEHGSPDWGSRLLQRNDAVKALNRAGSNWEPPFKLVTAVGAGPIAGGGTRKYVDANTYASSLAISKAKAPEVMFKGTETALRRCREELEPYLSPASRSMLGMMEAEAKTEARVAHFRATLMQEKIERFYEAEKADAARLKAD